MHSLNGSQLILFQHPDFTFIETYITPFSYEQHLSKSFFLF